MSKTPAVFVFFLMALHLKSQDKIAVKPAKAMIEDVEANSIASRFTIVQAGKITCTNNSIRIVSFSIGFLSPERNNYAVFPLQSPEFPEDIKEKIMSLRPGTRIFIDNIKAELADGSQMPLDPLWFDVLF